MAKKTKREKRSSSGHGRDFKLKHINVKIQSELERIRQAHKRLGQLASYGEILLFGETDMSLSELRHRMGNVFNEHIREVGWENSVKSRRWTILLASLPCSISRDTREK